MPNKNSSASSPSAHPVSRDTASATSLSRERRQAALARQITRLQRRLAELSVLDNRFTWARLLVFVTGFLLSGALFFRYGPTLWLPAAVVSLAAFAVVVALHRRLSAGIRRFELWQQLKATHLARMNLDWSQLPPEQSISIPPEHPFAIDLDFIGPRSLHRLIDVAVSQGGSRQLAQWLLDNDPTIEASTARQELVRELSPLVLFRDKLALNGRLGATGDNGGWNSAHFEDWLNKPGPDRRMKSLLLGLLLLAAINAALFILNQAGLLGVWWPYTLALYFGLYLTLGRDIRDVFAAALSFQDALQQLTKLFDFLETYRYANGSRLQALCRPFLDTVSRPSLQVRRISRVVNATGLSRNPVLWLVLNALLPWDLLFAYQLHGLRRNIAAQLPRWLDVWFRLEALSSLANLHYLNPHYTFPLLHSNPEGAPFAAQELGHPLIPQQQKVRNDFRIASIGQVDLITGSNMSGKSSFLRTLGVNLRLAYAGGPVDARRLETILFRLFTSIRVTDSVTDGVSYFYAEVKRLKALLEALQAPDPRPLFFLIDEIFRGTNNRERLLGSRAYIRQLSGKNGVGVIATHDLELVQLATELEQVNNYHFRDAVENGRMIFDYTLRPGPSPTTNALKIMAQEGLPVPPDLLT